MLGGLLATAMVLAPAGVAPAVAAQPDDVGAQAEADSTVLATDGSGHGASYWGPVPARADSLVIAFSDRSTAAWEAPFDAAWWLISAPFELLRWGLKSTVLALEDSAFLAWLRDLLAPVDLPWGFSLSASAGGIDGISGGLAFYHDDFFGNANHLRIKAAYSTRDDRQLAGGLVVPTTDGSAIEFGAGYRRRGQARYFGIGPESLDRDESYFTQEASWLGVLYDQALGGGGVSLQASTLYTTLDSRGPLEADDRDDHPLSEVFAGDLPRGYGDRADGWVLGLALQHDHVPETGRPREGALQRAQIGYFVPSRDAGTDFLAYRLESQNFFDLWWDRALAVRGAWSWIDGFGEEVHFQHMLTNDDPDLLRGYDDFRWRDRGFTALSLEYRYPVWDFRDPGVFTADAYTFVDTGQVFGRSEDLSLDHLTVSYGLGLRMSRGGGFMGRLEVGFSEEDTVIRLRADQVFQYAKRGLYHGREPLPLR